VIWRSLRSQSRPTYRLILRDQGCHRVQRGQVWGAPTREVGTGLLHEIRGQIDDHRAEALVGWPDLVCRSEKGCLCRCVRVGPGKRGLGP